MLLVDSISKDLAPWIQALRNELGDDRVVSWEEVDDPTKVEMAVLWNHRKDLFQHLTNVRVVASLGAGVDHIISDPLLPAQVRVSKVVSAHLSDPMSNFCIGAVIYFQRQFDKYAQDKVTKTWDQQFDPEVQMGIGILGLGELGTDLASKLRFLGFEVHGLSRTRREVPGVVTYGEEDMDAFLSRINLLICMLPATAATDGILSKSLFERMKSGSYLINVGRGRQQVDEDILAALDSGQLQGAFLDVFPSEPLPKTSLMWDHPKVFITPHIAVVTKIEAAVPQIAENYRRLQSGRELINLIDREKGY
ncbi:MAG: glyoxylate/hydroxypyruvate reductase A [Bacteroidota bacterium]